VKCVNVRERLIDNAIKVIAANGLDKTTTKAIVSGTDINEAYIYSNFSDKEELLARAFDSLDEELVSKLMLHLPIMFTPGLDKESRSRMLFTSIWTFLMGNREKCIAFIRYYYSPYFIKYSADDHKLRFRPAVEMFSSVFADEADVWMILNYILDVMLSFAVRVHNGHMREEDDYVEHIFRVIYRSVEQYFKKEENSNDE